MSELRLKPGISFAPSGLAFTDPKTGFKADGYERSIEGAVALLIDHRRANPKVYPADEPQHFSPALVKKEFLSHLHNKAPHLFRSEAFPDVSRSPVGKPLTCSCGSEAISPNYCKTCGSGQVQMGWVCDTCHKIFSA